MSYTTLAELYLKPFKVNSVLDVQIEANYNDHAHMTVTALLSEKMRDSYVDISNSYTVVQLMKAVQEINPDTKEKLDDIPLFSGYIKSIDVYVENHQYIMHLDVISCTCFLDIKRNSQTFQNINMTYAELFNTVLAKYKDIGAEAGYINAAKINQRIGKFIIQYEETDWNFLKRVASLLFQGLLPAIEYDKPAFYLGVPYDHTPVDLNTSQYTYHRDIQSGKHAHDNYNPTLIESAYTTYKINSHEIIPIGKPIDFKDIPKLYVKNFRRQSVKSVIENEYVVGQPQCFHQNCIYHSHLTGMSLNARVLNRVNDKVFVHFYNIDKEQDPATAYPFVYSTPYTADGNAGWYVMPEVGDIVRVYFPTTHEEDAYAMDSERQKQVGNRTDNPDVKYFRTAFGKEIVLAPNSLRISSKDGQVYIQMSDSGGILIYSSSGISISAAGDVSVSAGNNLSIQAAGDLVLSGESATVDIQDAITMTGSMIYEN